MRLRSPSISKRIQRQHMYKPPLVYFINQINKLAFKKRNEFHNKKKERDQEINISK